VIGSNTRLIFAFLVVASPVGAAPLHGQGTASSIRGTVVHAGTDEPIEGVEVWLNGQLATTTGSVGEFVIANVGWGTSLLVVRSIGYASLAMEVRVPNDEEQIELTIVLARAVTTLEPIYVSADALPYDRRLVEFAERRRSGFGHYAVREEFERYSPMRTTDILRRMPGVIAYPNPRYGISGDTRRMIVQSTRNASRLGGGACPMLYFKDGMYVGNSMEDLDFMISVNQVYAIEVYSGPSQTPPEFNRSGSNCGVIAFWTRLR
jgi:CarboxypepD_reg-like domain